MAVKDESLHHATEDLILPKPRRYYQALIHNSHWQLRSLIASPQPNIVYYASGQDITSLNTKTREREVIFSVKFAPRCLTASKEWICVGGDEGEYVAVSLADIKASREAALDVDFDADDRLPLDLDINSMHRFRESARRNRVPKPMTAKSAKVGMEIVNCITLWMPSAGVSRTAYTIPVSVVANNDRTVIIQSLSEDAETLQKITFPACVNRAVISPDGFTLATISDDPYLYIHERRRIERSKESWINASNPNLDYEWVQMCRIQLEGQGRAEEQHEMKGCFAVCFSSTGRYLAVATQFGIIQVFEVGTITESGSLVAVFTTSRPCAGIRASSDRDCGGAVRAMAFSPGPFDLLAWTESSGRVGVADMRSLYFSRQLLMLDHSDASIDRVQVTTKSYRESLLDPRLRPLQADVPSSTTTPDYLGLDFDRRQLRHLHRELGHRGHQTPLTAEELSVLQAHRIARRQRDAASAPQDTSNDTSMSRWMRTDPSSEASDRATTRDFLSERQLMLNHLLGDDNQSRERRVQINHLPRRRNSISMAAAQGTERDSPAANTSTPGAGAGAGTISHAASILNRLALMAGRPANSTSSSNPWADVSAFISTRGTEAYLPERTTRLRIELEDDSLRNDISGDLRRDFELRRDFAHRLRQPWGSVDIDDIVSPSDSHRIPDTMGLAWSADDGRILYAGASDGIYEFHVNITGRKVFPDLVLR